MRVMDAVKETIADVSSVCPSRHSLWRRANDRNVSYSFSRRPFTLINTPLIHQFVFCRADLALHHLNSWAVRLPNFPASCQSGYLASHTWDASTTHFQSETFSIQPFRPCLRLRSLPKWRLQLVQPESPRVESKSQRARSGPNTVAAQAANARKFVSSGVFAFPGQCTVPWGALRRNCVNTIQLVAFQTTLSSLDYPFPWGINRCGAEIKANIVYRGENDFTSALWPLKHRFSQMHEPKNWKFSNFHHVFQLSTPFDLLYIH